MVLEPLCSSRATKLIGIVVPFLITSITNGFMCLNRIRDVAL